VSLTFERQMAARSADRSVDLTFEAAARRCAAGDPPRMRRTHAPDPAIDRTVLDGARRRSTVLDGASSVCPAPVRARHASARCRAGVGQVPGSFGA
jgi:hypothetical protein